MPTTVLSEKFLKHIHKNHYKICKYFGNAKPHLCQIQDSFWPTFSDDELIKGYLSNLIFSIFKDTITEDIDITENGPIIKMLSSCKIFMHTWRLLSYFLCETWLPDDGETEGLSLLSYILSDCTEFAVHGCTKARQKQTRNSQTTTHAMSRRKHYKKMKPAMRSSSLSTYITKKHYKSLIKIQNILSVSNSHHTCLLAKSRYTLQHKPLTSLKRKLSSGENIIITKRISYGLNPNSIYSVIKPSVNYVKQASTIELCFIQAAKLSASSLFSLLMSLKEIPADVDVNYVVSGLVEMARSRLRTKFIEVNKEYCTCHTKCTGYNVNGILNVELVHKGLKRSTTISCCQRCMLSPLVQNTRARRPRMKICVSNPGLETCSLDNCSMFRDVLLYTCEYRGYGKYKYQHLFYMTNTVNIIEELSERKTTGPSSVLYGMCFGGSRTCLFRLQLNICSSLKMEKGSSCTQKERYMCKSCLQAKMYLSEPAKLINPLFGTSKYDKNTCVNLALCDLEKGGCLDLIIKNICLGCKLKFLCCHTMVNVARGINNIKPSNFNKKLYKKAINRALLVVQIKHYLMTHNE